MSLDDLRNKIDEDDTKIVRLIAERIRIAEQIGKEKKKRGKQVQDADRENRVLEHVRHIAKRKILARKTLIISTAI